MRGSSIPGWQVVAGGLVLMLAACGGGGGGGGTSAPPVVTEPPVVAPPPAPPVATAISLQSDAGDFIGQGLNYSYDPTNALIAVNVSAQGAISLSVRGDEQWQSDLVPPAGSNTFSVGRYEGLPASASVDPSKGSFRWFGGGRGCAASNSSVIVDQVAYVSGVLSSFSVRFSRYCDGATAALRGDIQWTRSDTRSMPALPASLPAGLWQPAADAVPASGDYLILDSSAGDPVALGRSLRYTTADTSILVNRGPNSELAIQIAGRERWIGLLQFPESQGGTPVVGYYPGLHRTPLHNPGRGGLNWSGEGRSCTALDGWLAIDRVVVSQNTLTALEARFEQRCQGSAGLLRGALRWTAPARVPVPQPLSTPGSWSADASLPATGNVLFMESGRSDFLGGRLTHTATPLTAVMSVSASSGLLAVESNGEQHWFGQVQPSADTGPLRPGTYAGLGRYLFGNTPGQAWTMGSSCTLQDSWLVIDDVQYRGAQLSAIALRFDGRCSTGDVLRGQLRWSDADQRQPAGPQAVPDTFWRAPASALPPSGSYVHLEADPWITIIKDQQTRYTQANAVIAVAADGTGVSLRLRGEDYRDGKFQPMAGQVRLQPGYYPGLRGLPANDPSKGGMSWVGSEHSCSDFAESFVIDSVTYVGDRLDALDLRFEQNCADAVVPSVRGQVRWRSDDTTRPPGPVTAPPASLWRPPPGATPATGGYLYTQSEPGDALGSGQTSLTTPAMAAILVTPRGLGVDITAGTVLTAWTGHLEPMGSLTRLEPGYYASVKDYPNHYNPARGGLTWSGRGVGCNSSLGWFVVDSVSYEGSSMSALRARFEIYCEDSSAPLHGEINWSR